MAKTNNKLPPVHPGEILSEDLMQPLGIETPDLARALKIPAARLRDIVSGRRAIDTNVALRLARYFDSTAEFWLNLQAAYDLRVASELSAQIAKEVRPRKAA
jgi:addiction module HigA family antidote